jgi:hypothetical protein
MRDLLSKLDALISETALKDKEDLEAKRKALADLEADPVASKDPEISAAIDQRRSDLEKEAKSKGITGKDFDDDDRDWDKEDIKGYADRAADADADDYHKEGFEIGDAFGISFSEDFEIGAEIVDILEDGIVIELDETAIGYLSENGFTFDEGEIFESEQHGNSKIYDKCWKGYKKVPGKKRGELGSCEKISESGLQYYTGKKKYGKEGMAALAAAGREGASEEELGKIKDKYKKEDAGKESMVEADGNLNMLVDKTVKALIMAKDKGIRSLPEPAYADDQDLVEFMEQHLPNIMNKVPDDSWNDFADAVFNKFFNASGKDNIELEAKYQGREVPLGKPMSGDVKKSKVYVKNPQGNVVKVNFGDKKMRIKKSNPNRRKSFRARHNCANPGPRHKARYWSCRAW